MSKAIVTFEDDGDQIKVDINFGEGGGSELSPAHNMAVMAVQLATQVAGQPGAAEQGEIV